MCQQGQAEITVYRSQERDEIRARYKMHKRGEIELSDDDLASMAVRLFMLQEQ